MKLGIIIETKEFEKVWNAMRFAITAKQNGNQVKVFLMGESIEIETLVHDKYDISKQIKEFNEIGGCILACGNAVKARKIDGMREYSISTMIDCVHMVEWAQKIVTF